MAVLAGLLGPGAHYRGDLVFQGAVRIDGTLEGSLKTDDLVEVASTGLVRGEIDAAQALVAGTVEGILRARERVTLLSTARITGKLVTPWLDVANGARIQAEVTVKRRSGE